MKPENASFIRLFDYFAAVIFGVAAAVATGYAIPTDWSMAFAMPLAMILGMITAFPLLGLFAKLMGGFEIIMMSMQIGMLAGMVGIMIPYGSLNAFAFSGALVGFIIQFFLHMMDMNLHGEALMEKVSNE